MILLADLKIMKDSWKCGAKNVATGNLIFMAVAPLDPRQVGERRHNKSQDYP